MSTPDLPERAKPEVLYDICRAMKGDGGFTRSEVYNAVSAKTRDLRRAITLGRVLGFVEPVGDDRFRLTKRGTVLSYQSSFDGRTVEELFREAIEAYEPYRDILAGAYERDVKSDVMGDACVTQSDFKGVAEDVLARDVENREVNLLIKTAAAAGLGEYRTGKRGYETRLILSEAYDPFVGELVDEYTKQEGDVERNDDASKEGGDGPVRDERSGGEADENDASELPETTAASLKLTVELNVGDRSNEEIADLLGEIRELTDN